MPTPIVPSPAERFALIRRRWAEGATQAQIAGELGVDVAQVGYDIVRMRRAGEQLPPRRTVRTAGERRAREQMVADMWTASASLDQIGRALGVRNPSSVIHRMRQAGWDLPRRRKAPDLPSPTRDRIVERWRAGLTLREIARVEGMTSNAVAAALSAARRAGVDTSRRST